MRSFVFVAALALASGAIQKSFNGKLIDGEYIVVFHDNVTDDARASHMQRTMLGGARVMFEYSTVLKGYAVAHDDETALLKIAEDPAVNWVEQNQEAHAIGGVEEAGCREETRSSNGLYGLRRASRPRINTEPMNSGTGAGIDVYIIDTGIRTTHNDFSGRATHAFDCTGQGAGDGNGHGTHCAGTAGGDAHGFATSANLKAVKVLNSAGSGSFACVISGIEFVGAQSGLRIGSLSLGGGFSAAVNNAVDGAVRAGAAMASASGNSNANACNFSPASAPLGVAVNSHDNADRRSSFSNFGTCTDIFAAGTNVLSAWIGSDSDTRTISGTSMACPHVAGILAETWANNPSLSAPDVQNLVIRNGQQGPVTNPGTGSPNVLAQTSCA